MDLGLIFRVLVLLAVANGAPVMAKNIFGETASWPVDFYRQFGDGQPLLGNSKTIRGVAAAILLTVCFAPLIGLSWQVGALTAVGAMVGDLLSSFVKRRLGMPPSSMAPGLDQIPESFFGALAAGAALPLDVSDAAIVSVVFLCGQLVVSRLSYAVGLRDRPY